jgi:hypothetical protein
MDKQATNEFNKMKGMLLGILFTTLRSAHVPVLFCSFLYIFLLTAHEYEIHLFLLVPSCSLLLLFRTDNGLLVSFLCACFPLKSIQTNS